MTQGYLRAGAGRAAIPLPERMLPIDGFDAVLDPLHVRILVLDDDSVRVSLVVIEMTSLPAWAVDLLRTAAADFTGTGEPDVIVAVSHTFSAPHLAPEPAHRVRGMDLFAALVSALREAAGQALRALVPAVGYFGRGRCRINVSRDAPTASGWWLGTNDGGVTDDEVAVMRFDTSDGATLAVLACYAVQSSILDSSHTLDGCRMVSADLLGAASRHAESSLDAVVVTLVGAAGDQAPTVAAVRRVVGRRGEQRTVDAHEAGHVIVNLLGERLGAAIVQAAGDAAPVCTHPLAVNRRSVTVPAQVPPARREDLHPSHEYEFVPDGQSQTSVMVLEIGDTWVVGVRPELNAVTGLAIKANSPSDKTLVATLVDGAAKYMADVSGYDRCTYEAMNSSYGRGAAETLAAAAIAMLTELRGCLPEPEGGL